MERDKHYYDAEAHYQGNIGPIEHSRSSECEMAIENVGWTLGNDCPYNCNHCYSLSARRKGANLEKSMVDRIVSQLSRLRVKTVNLGGNEPIFTNGLNPKKTLLPYIITSLVNKGIHVGLTTSGISLILLEREYPEITRLLNDIDISFDSPYEEEHNLNRGAALYQMAIKSLEICQNYQIDRTIIMAAMAWNFTHAHIQEIIRISKKHASNIRINLLKPVQREHLEIMPSPNMFYDGFALLMKECHQVDLSEPLLATVCSHSGGGCPCGRTSFRIHSITPDEKVPVSPCVYLHDYKVGNLLTDDIFEIVYSQQFRAFRRRTANPEFIEGCQDCPYLLSCRGGCAARSYLYALHTSGFQSLFVKDPYCLMDQRNRVNGNFPSFPLKPTLPEDKVLVHRNYLCTWIGRPK